METARKPRLHLALFTLALIATAVLSGCTQSGAVPEEKRCALASDCACGVRIGEVEAGQNHCFYGNKAFVNESVQCPDYCTGIAGNLEITCVLGECTQAARE